jgi:MFS family permease
MSGDTPDIKKEQAGLGWRVSLSIIVGVSWCVFLILWLFFFAYPLGQWEKNVAILLLSLLIICGILGVPWAYWAIKNQTAKDRELWELKGFKSRLWVSIIIALIFFVFLICWFWFYAVPYSVFQNLAIFIVCALIVGGILGAMWAPWGMKHRPEQHHHDDKQ